MTSATRVSATAATVVTAVWKPVVLAAYCAILAVIAVHHEPWFDEAQAWLLARDASVPDLFFLYLRYEGTPGLWHLLVMAPAKMGFPYWTMHLLAALFSTAATAMILWLSPFPPAIRIAIPFTYFLLYQYAVVARSYALLAPLLFAIAWFLPRARSRPWILIALLVALANVSIHGTFAAIGILVAYLIDIRTDPDFPKPVFSRQLIVSCGVLLLAVVAIALEVWPVSSSPFIQHITDNITRISHLRTHLGRGKYQIREAFSSALPIALVSLALSVFWMARNRTALYFALPAGLVVAFSSFIYASPWHAGVLFMLWLFAMWIASSRNPRTTPLYVWFAWAMVLGMHVYWAARAGLTDINEPYSGSKAVAENIAPDVAAGKRIAGRGFYLIAVQPYFGKNIFVNYYGGRNLAFWFPTPSNDLADSPASLASQHPDVIVVSLWRMQPWQQDKLIRSLSDYGYTAIREFPGKIIWKTGILVDDSYWVARKKPGP